MKKGIKFAFFVIMFIGIVFSIVNFTSVDVKAGGLLGSKGIWVDVNGHLECMYIGNLCDLRSPIEDN